MAERINLPIIECTYTKRPQRMLNLIWLYRAGTLDMPHLCAPSLPSHRDIVGT